MNKNKFMTMLIGRPNVGKSTIFNKLIGAKTAHTSDIAGTTVDVNTKEVSYMNTDFLLADSGGFNLHPANELEKQIIHMVFKYAEKVDLFLLVVDYKAGLIPEDIEIYRNFIKYGVNIFLLINKVDSIKNIENALSEFGKIGIKNKFALSAENSIGIDDVLESIVEEFKSSNLKCKKDKNVDETIKIAIVGKPNSGKSTYINTVLKDNLIQTGAQPGTTRDSIDSVFNYKCKKIILIDTAGIRKKSKLDFNSANFQKQTISSIERADIVCVFIDIQHGLTHDDLSLLKLVTVEKKQFLIAFTKWDIIKLDSESNTIQDIKNEIELNLKEFADSHYIFISSKENKNIYKIIDICIEIYGSRNIKIKTSDINEFISVQKNNLLKGNIFKHIAYGVQKNTDEIFMPTFIFFTDNKGKIFSMKDIKFIRNTIKTYFKIKSNVEVLIEYKNYQK